MNPVPGICAHVPFEPGELDHFLDLPTDCTREVPGKLYHLARPCLEHNNC